METATAIAGPLKKILSRRSLLSAAMVPALGGARQAAPQDEPIDPPPNPLADAAVRIAHLLRRAGFSASKSE
ncbi:MAG: hypothetical protein AAB289_00200, partial [Chloroflexota bacterium]